MAEQRWVPLESNPDVLNKYIHNLGASKEWSFVDVYGLDDDLLAMVPQPVAAIMLLYPKSEKADASEIGSVDEDGLNNTYFVKQTIRNACGTIALVHALANNTENMSFDGDKHFSKFLENTKSLTPEERGSHLEKDTDMGTIHDASAQEGQTQAPSREEDVSPHFVAFVHAKGHLYELDGRKDFPVNHGATSQDNFLKDTAVVLKKFMEREPESLDFAITALVKDN